MIVSLLINAKHFHRFVVFRSISSMNSLDTDASVLMNAHYDSPVNSPGAGDCGSCVGEFGTISLDFSF